MARPLADGYLCSTCSDGQYPYRDIYLAGTRTVCTSTSGRSLVLDLRYDWHSRQISLPPALINFHSTSFFGSFPYSTTPPLIFPHGNEFPWRMAQAGNNVKCGDREISTQGPLSARKYSRVPHPCSNHRGGSNGIVLADRHLT